MSEITEAANFIKGLGPIDTGPPPSRATRSDTIGKLADALCKAQGTMEGAHKSAENPFFKSKYADLASVWDACRGPLSANGLAVIQVPAPTSAPGRIAIDTILAHSSGEWISGVLELTPVKSDPQSVGSAITYARRYGLQAIVGIAPEDDDGNAASGTDKAGTNDHHWPKALTKEQVAEKKAAGQLRGQKPFVRPPSKEQEAEAQAWAMNASEPTIDQKLKAISEEARLKHAAADPGAVNGHCDSCGSPLVTMASESKDNPGRKYLICHHYNMERARLRTQGKDEKTIAVLLKEHTRTWLPQVPA